MRRGERAFSKRHEDGGPLTSPARILARLGDTEASVRFALVAELGGGETPRTAAAAFEALSSRVGAFGGMSYEEMGTVGLVAEGVGAGKGGGA